AAGGGDRERGRGLADDRARGADLRTTPAGDAMANVLEAIAAASGGETTRARLALDRAASRNAELAAHDRAFIGYLGGIAFVEMGAITDARATWTHAIDAAPDTIGSALARRERSPLPVD